MPIRPVVLYPDPVLLAPTKPVAAIDDEIRQLVRDMIDTMYAAPGIGLAANQVGVPLRLCVVDLSVGETPGELRVLINPEIRATSGSEVAEEGCLSFPDVTVDVERSFQAVVEALDLDGAPVTIDGTGMLARVMQHEIEHLDGRTFLSNVSPLKREMIKRQIKKRIKAGDWIATVTPR